MPFLASMSIIIENQICLVYQYIPVATIIALVCYIFIVDLFKVNQLNCSTFILI